MKTFARALAACVAVGIVVPLSAAPAHAETVAETASVGAYYLASNPGNVGKVGDTTLPGGEQRAPGNAKDADGVAQDDLAVAVVAAGTGQPDKFSALLWDLIDLSPGAKVTKATVVVPFTTKDSRTTDKDPANVVACLAGPEGFGDGDGEPMSDAPTQEACKEDATPAPAKATSVEGGKALEFDITAIAQAWTENNTGLLLFPSKQGFGKPFQTVFGDKSTARLTVAFVPAPEEDLPVDDAELSLTADDVAAPVDDTGSFDAGTPLDAGTSFDSSGSSSFDAGTGSASLDVGTALPLDAPLTAEEPEVAAAATTGAPIERARSVLSPMSFDAVTWVGLLLGAGLLTVVSLALGAPPTVPGSGPPARLGGVASALAARRPGSFAGLQRP